MATPTAQQPLLDAIYQTLIGNSPVNAAVGGRVLDTLPPQNPANPFILITILADPPVNYFAEDDILTIFQVDVYGKLESGPEATRQIADSVYAALNRNVTITANGYTGLSILCTERGNGIETDLVVGPRTQQDSLRQMQIYKLFGSGS